MFKLWSGSKQTFPNCKFVYSSLRYFICEIIVSFPKFLIFCNIIVSLQLDYQTVLHLSSRLGHWKLTALFCSEEIDADPNVTDIKNFTPLHYACLAGNIKDSRILLNTGANVIVQNYVSK